MKDNKFIKELVQKLVDFRHEITRIYLISVKVGTSGNLKSFKLGLIVDDCIKSTSELAASIYFNIDSELPFDIVIYTQTEFYKLNKDVGTFAYKIVEAGTVLYG